MYKIDRGGGQKSYSSCFCAVLFNLKNAQKTHKKNFQIFDIEFQIVFVQVPVEDRKFLRDQKNKVGPKSSFQLGTVDHRAKVSRVHSALHSDVEVIHSPVPTPCSSSLIQDPAPDPHVEITVTGNKSAVISSDISSGSGNISVKKIIIDNS